MKKIVCVLVLSVLIFSLILTGCSQPAQTPQQPAQTPQQPAQTPVPEPQKVIELKAAWGFPESIVLGSMVISASDRVEERSGGRIKITNYFAQSLLSQEDTYTGLASGIADIAGFPVSWLMGTHDLNMVFGQLFAEEPPALGEDISKAYYDLFHNNPELQEEFAKTGTRMIGIYSQPFYELHTVDKPVKVPGDLSGMSITTMAGEASDWINSISGAAAVNLPTGDYYMGLERGLVNGQFLPFAGIAGYNLLEVVKHHTIFSPFAPAAQYHINLKTYDSLSPDLQEIVDEAYQWALYELYAVERKVAEETLQKAKDQGNTIIYLTPEERKLWAEYMMPITDKWIKDCEAKGLPARKIYNELMQLFEQYR